MKTIKITYDGETIALKCDLAEASAPLIVDGEHTQYQTADARHRTTYAVALACQVAWPAAEWPWPEEATIPEGWGDDFEAWCEMAYETTEDRSTTDRS